MFSSILSFEFCMMLCAWNWFCLLSLQLDIISVYTLTLLWGPRNVRKFKFYCHNTSLLPAQVMTPYPHCRNKAITNLLLPITKFVWVWSADNAIAFISCLFAVIQGFLLLLSCTQTQWTLIKHLFHVLILYI